MIYGYVRVSTKEQNIDRQIIAMHEYGIKNKNIYSDKQTGANFERRNYQKLLKRLKENDILVIKSIDRLGRNYREILEQWRIITKVKKADVIVIDIAVLNTTIHKDLLGTFIADIVLQLLSYVAENERTLIRQRQAEGIAAAKAKGVKFGRPIKYRTENYIQLFEMYRNKQISKTELKGIIGCGENTFYRLKKETAKMINTPLPKQ